MKHALPRSPRENLPPVQIASSPELRPLLEKVVSPAAEAFLEELHLRFESRRQALLEERASAALFASEEAASRAWMRDREWRVPAAPSAWTGAGEPTTVPATVADLRRAAAEGVRFAVADFTGLLPRWAQLLEAQRGLRVLAEEERGFLRGLSPRPLSVSEKRFRVRGEAMSASLFDFGLFAFHLGELFADRHEPIYVQLTRLRSHREARFWADVFVFTGRVLGLPLGGLRAGLVVDSAASAAQAEEMLHELRDHAVWLKGVDADQGEELRAIADRRGLPAIVPAAESSRAAAPATGDDLEGSVREDMDALLAYLRPWVREDLDAVAGAAGLMVSAERALARLRTRRGEAGTFLRDPACLPAPRLRELWAGALDRNVRTGSRRERSCLMDLAEGLFLREDAGGELLTAAFDALLDHEWNRWAPGEDGSLKAGSLAMLH